MSGPWDRPSSDDPDASWPSEDLRTSSDRDASRDAAREAARDPGSAGAPGWDDWPPAPPPPDDYLTEEPLPPSSDPWAESWTEEEADAMLRSASGPPEPEPDRWEPPPAAAPMPPEREAQPAPEPEPTWRREPEADEATPEAPRVEPWSPDPDPWHFEPVPEAAPESVPPTAAPGPETDQHPIAEERVDADRVDEDGTPAHPLAGPAAETPEPAPVTPRWPSRSDELPDWLAEPPPAQPEHDADDVAAAIEPITGPPAELEPTVDEPVADDAAAHQPSLEAQPEAEGEEESGSFWNSILPWRSAAHDHGDAPTEEPEAGAEAVPEAMAETVAEPVAEPDSAPERAEEPDVGAGRSMDADQPTPVSLAEADADPAFEPRWPASVPEPESQAEPEPEPEPEPEKERPAFVPIGATFTYEPSTEPESLTQPGPEPEPEPEPEPAPDERAAEPWSEPDWSDRGESTRVLPTDWTPSTPEPPRTGELEPTAGTIRTRLAEPDADADADELTAPTIAEQAVPWLIGVILLLAGMVIVLLALIFAGDGSLGGGAPSPSPSPRPTLAVVAPGAGSTATPTPTPGPTTSESPAGTPKPTATPQAVPEYGPLEMVYQGRSAALAPIYLLRRDFTVEEEPTVLAQDGSFDVRRFAWAPDGRVGAGLLVDVLVSIEPGQEKRRLGDGLTTITFGDDASTVYAARITEDGANDSATVLAIDFLSGDTEELATISYARPQLDDEAALAEAAFSDDGGPVRLYWMSNDTLRLWAIGAGAWTIDPADGEVTELDGAPLPTLLAPNGRERIGLEQQDGVTTLTFRDMNERPLASTTVEGAVSHLRWAPGGDMVVFTVGRAAPGGGIIQDLFLWYLDDGEEPTQITNTGAAFGAEWLGTQPRWHE